MTPNKITSRIEELQDQDIFCPILKDLNAAQADCAAMMPMGDANSTLLAELRGSDVKETVTLGVFCSDPFMNQQAFFKEIYDMGGRHIVNWPSLVLLDHNMKKAMHNIGLDAENEYNCLLHAKTQGFNVKAMVSSLNQAKRAINLGLTELILHPGFDLSRSQASHKSLHESLSKFVENITAIDSSINVYLYQHAEQSAKDFLKDDDLLDKISGIYTYGAS